MNGLRVYQFANLFDSRARITVCSRRSGNWNQTLGTPVWSLLLQMIIALAMVVGVGTEEGQEFLNVIVEFVLGPPPTGQTGT